ncbi:class I SAM-dependent methyltransferase [Oceanicoccus sp. KOV_DT_Chl]|uniref:class I SAM-dependent methyltransferase n=1 Tax=Oceanicoccus sp. KOV_DT_Chl TaxID=1904639 RepID=UPI000C7AE034|nr:methyltransferase [Oceanicoccus sp. KOV_DT_Chl]
MSDHAFDLLCHQLAILNKEQRALWVVDENIAVADLVKVTPLDNLTVMTNRYDLSLALSQHGFSVLLSDFDFSEFEHNSLDRIYYRVSKEKPVVHHVINNAGVYLSAGGELCLAGYKNEGAKTYSEKAQRYLGELVEKQRSSNSSILACLRKGDMLSAPLDDHDYKRQVDVTTDVDGRKISLCSKPGVYGWKKIDRGSAFLVQHLDQLLQSMESPPASVLDLGCGFGYLSVLAALHCDAEFTATDNNVSSVALCEINFQRFAISGSVVLDNCAASINNKFDLVLCNPPFHQGFDVSGELTDRFLQTAKRLLKPKGRAFFVVNSFIPLERKAKGFFSDIDMLANNGSFKLLVLTP